MAAATQRYIAVIADMVRSRDVPTARRRLLQKRFSELIATLNREYRKAIAARFVITLGDEFQGLFNSAALIPDLVWRLEQDFPERELRVGIGLGRLDTPIQKVALNIDGPALHAAREAIEHAKRTKALGGVFRGFRELDDILNGMARLLWFHRSRWTDSQWKIASLLRKGMSQTQAAKKLGIKKQVVSRQALASGCSPYIAAENAWRMILQKQVDLLLRSRHGRSQSH